MNITTALRRVIAKLFIVLFFCFTTSTPTLAINNPDDVYDIASVLGNKGKQLGKLLTGLEDAIGRVTNNRERGLIYMAAKEVENISLIIILQGELLGVSQLIKQEQRANYYPHMIDILKKGAQLIQKKLITIKEAQSYISEVSVKLSLGKSISLIEEAKKQLDYGIEIIEKINK